jgi:hypothetical protein
MPQREAALHVDTLAIEGGLFTAEWLTKVAAQQAPAQADADYGVRAGFTLREEIALAWRSAQALWSQFNAARAQPHHDAWAVTQRFTTELLRQCFAFQLQQATHPRVIDERHYPVPFSALSGRVPVVLSPHDETKPLDSAQERLGDNSGDRVRRRSAFGLLQETLNAQSDALWGLATNGVLLRIARDNASLTRPAWVEVDLERLFIEERFADFSVLWLLLHASRFGGEGGAATDCALEQWRSSSREQGTRARETLRVGVEQALLVLGQGFVSHPANTALRESLTSGALSAQDYFKELLRLVYRQIFLLTIEEREILHAPGADSQAVALYAQGYGLRRLRDRAVRRSAHDRYGDLWQGLKQVWLGLAVGQSVLALPPLGGLFETSQCPHLDAARLENRHLLLALFHLAWLRAEPNAPLSRVNWRDMGPEELGSIYESLLELVPLLSQEHRQFSFQTGAAVRGNARKTTGSYYTADPLVQEQLDSALEPVIAAILAAHPTGDGAVQALLSISVIDPACGSGHFLLAAARRIAGHLARVRAQMRDAMSGNGGQPTPDDYRHALRDVVTHCVYGVDMNPMALELARMALWLEAYTPDAPLGFIDHHFKLGNALLGVMDPKTLLEGVPDEAYKELTGDVKALCRDLKRRNKQEREGLKRMRAAASFSQSLQAMDLSITAAPLQQLDALPDATLADIAAKRQAYAALQHGAGDDGFALALHLYCAAYLLPKHGTERSTDVPTTQDVMNALMGQPVAPQKQAAALRLAERTPLLHWRIAFAQVFARGGFTVVLANPPWERMKLQEEEYFAARAPAVAAARNKAERERAINALATHALGTPERQVHDDFVAAKQHAEAGSEYCHGPRYPLTGRGDVNTYALFAETSVQILHPNGRAGLVLPSGIATDESTSAFFGEISRGRIAQLIDFENREAIFPGVHRSYKFCLLTIGAAPEARFAFFLGNTEQLKDPRRSFTLSAEDIARLNPNSRTCPVFRSQRDAEIAKRIYQRVPVLWDDSRSDPNPWGFDYMTKMFDMADSSHDFVDLASLRNARSTRDALTVRTEAGETLTPLLEAKHVAIFDHRWSSGLDADLVSDEQKRDTNFLVTPRYWMPAARVPPRLASKEWSRSWLMGWRDICRATDERTAICAVFPGTAVAHTLRVMFVRRAPELAAAFLGCLSSLVFDFLARQKVGGTHLTVEVLRQLPVPSPSDFGEHVLSSIAPRVLELTYTAHDLRPFYADVVAANPTWDSRTGADRGQPWQWNPERRALLRAELDAIYARLYGLTRDDLRYILDPADVMGDDYPSETFRVLKDKEIRQFREYRTRRLVLEAWDRFDAAAGTLALQEPTTC